MHKLIYISYVMEDISPGYKEKIRAQAKSFNNLGFKTYLYTSTTKGACLYEISNNEYKKIYFKKYTLDFNNPFHKGLNIIDFCSGIKEINNLLKPDVVYIRRIIPITKLLLSSINNYKKNNVVVVYEYPTYPWKKEMISGKSKLMYLLYLVDCLNYNKLIKLADIVTVILGENIKLSNKFIEITNGISMEDIKIKKHSKTADGVLNLIGVAQVKNYHGYDRLIDGMKNYYNEKSDMKVLVYFHIVGIGSELKNLRQLVIEYNLSDYIIFHGIKTGEELDNLFATCDLGIGSLGNHRKGLTKDSALKNREYCARGIPFLIASNDDCFKEDFKYILKVEPDEFPIDIKQIIEFYYSIDKENYTEEIRNYAEEKLNWDNIMNPVAQRIFMLINNKSDNK